MTLFLRKNIRTIWGIPRISKCRLMCKDKKRNFLSQNLIIWMREMKLGIWATRCQCTSKQDPRLLNHLQVKKCHNLKRILDCTRLSKRKELLTSINTLGNLRVFLTITRDQKVQSNLKDLRVQWDGTHTLKLSRTILSSFSSTPKSKLTKETRA